MNHSPYVFPPNQGFLDLASRVDTYGDLPDASTQANNFYYVRNTTGIWLINQHKSGFYYSNGNVYVWDGSAWINQKDSSVSSASALDKPYLAGSAVAARDVVYISASGKVSPANGDVESTSRVVGLALASAAASVALSVRSMGLLSGFSSLTPGARYFLSASSAGAITSTPPSGTSDAIIQVGYAKSATELDIMVQVIAIKAS